MSTPHFLQPLLGRDGSGLFLYAANRPDPLATRIVCAFDSQARKRGLLDRDSMEAGEALIIAPCSGVHTFGMRFPIDVIYAARDGRVLKISETLVPSRLSVGLRAFAVVEMAAGAAGRARLRAADHLVIRSGVGS
jgi:uncharacterized membrane protein (UPF0127 family)